LRQAGWRWKETTAGREPLVEDQWVAQFGDGGGAREAARCWIALCGLQDWDVLRTRAGDRLREALGLDARECADWDFEFLDTMSACLERRWRWAVSAGEIETLSDFVLAVGRSLEEGPWAWRSVGERVRAYCSSGR